jgi:hypothetical protein
VYCILHSSQDFACINSKAKNKELVLVAEKSFGAKWIDDDTEEEAETEVRKSLEQEKPLADNTDNAEKPDIVEEVEMERSEDNTDDDDPGEEEEQFIKGDGFKDDSEDTADEEVMKQDEERVRISYGHHRCYWNENRSPRRSSRRHC